MGNNTLQKSIIGIILCLLLLSGCQASSSLSTTPATVPSSTPEITSAPTATPTPTASPSPTPEPTPVPTPSPTPKPLHGVTFGIDAGHQRKANLEKEPMAPKSTTMKSKVSGGTWGDYSRMYEYEFNLDVALRLQTYLEDLGAEVIMIRTTHDVNISNVERAQLVDEKGCDAWVRIHANGSKDPEKYGMFMLIPTVERVGDINYNKSAYLAKCILDEAIQATGAKRLGIRHRYDIAGFNWSTIPVCLIEAGHMSNEKEDKLLGKAYYRDQIASGMAQGILKYFTQPQETEK